MSNTYHGSRRKQTTYNKLLKELLVFDDSLDDYAVAPTLAGEILRAGNRIYVLGTKFCHKFCGANLVEPSAFLIANLPENNPILDQLSKTSKFVNHYPTEESADALFECLEQILNYVIDYVSAMDHSTLNTNAVWDFTPIQDDGDTELDFNSL